MTKAKKGNKWLIWSLVGLLIVLLIGAFFKGKNRPKGKAVEMAEASKRSIKETVSASGRIFPETEVKISSDVSGEIVELLVEEGDSVIINQILAKIDPEAYVSTVERGLASVNSSKAQAATALANVENSRAQIEQIKAQLLNAKNTHERNVQLMNEGVISAVEFEASESNLKSLEANLKAAEAGLSASQKNAESAEFAVKSAEASLKELRTNLSRTTIKAPTSGIVSSLSVEEGERVVGTIQMTGTEMMRISNLNNMEVQVDVNENDVPRVHLNDLVEIDVDAYPDKKFTGKVTQIANSASNLTALGGGTLTTDQVINFTVTIAIDPNSYRDLVAAGNTYPFRPGMSASVDIYTDEVKDVISVPIQAVTIREKDEAKDKKQKLSDEDYEEVIFVVKADTVDKVTVVTGIQDDEYIQIRSGLEENEKIVIGPYTEVSKKLEEGDEVTEKEVKKNKDDD
jgi:HlyD family secretion protein